MNHKQPAVIYKRHYSLKNGKQQTVYWYYVFDENGRRRRFSLGTTSKTRAKYLVAEKIRNGTLIPKENKKLTFEAFADNFWEWEKCLYIQGRLLRGERISRKWARQNRGYLNNHLMPAFKNLLLTEITVSGIEKRLFSLKSSGKLSNKSVNQVFCSLRTILEEAVRLGHLDTNPCTRVKLLKQEYRPRGILTFDEVKKLFSDPSIWEHPVYYAINLTACVTGARLGELRALKVGKLHPERIIIDSVVRALEGYVEGDTKTGAKGFRDVPIPSFAYTLLSRIAQGRESDGFVFSLSGETPIGPNNATRALYQAMEKIGINEEKRQERNITFHSWRHFFHSRLRGRISDSELRISVGHRSEAMTERYSHRMPEHIERFRVVQEEAFSDLSL